MHVLQFNEGEGKGLSSLHAAKFQLRFRNVIGTSSMTTTRAKRARDADREAKRAIPRANALPSRAVPNGFRCRRVRARHPVRTPRIRSNEANAFRGPTARKRITLRRGSYRGNIGKSVPRVAPIRFRRDDSCASD